MARSPKGLIDVGLADEHVPAAEALESSISAVEAWAFGILKAAGIEVKSSKALELAVKREHADPVHWALMSIHHAQRLRHSVGIAATKSEEAKRQAIWAASRMWQFCSAAFSGKFVQNEEPLFKGNQFTEGPKQPRRDLLAKIIDDALIELGRNAKAIEVLSHIKLNPAVQEVDEERTIWWRDVKHRQQETSFKAFQNRLSGRRKLIHKK
jgi:hypothetical protein